MVPQRTPAPAESFSTTPDPVTMGVMKNHLRLSTFVVLSVLACLLVPAAASAMPTAGSNELRIDNTYVLPGYGYSGFNHLWSSESGAGSADMFGFGLAYGRFVTEVFEVGTGLTLIYVGGDGANSTVIPGFSPFLRLFHPVGPSTAIFGAALVGVHFSLRDEGPTITILSPGIDLGFEFFPAESWSLRVGPSYRYVHESISGDSLTLHSVGVNWAIAGYF